VHRRPYQALGEWQNRFFALPVAMGSTPDRQRLRLHLRQPGHRPEKIAERATFSSAGRATTSRTERLYEGFKKKMEVLIEEITNLLVPDSLSTSPTR
jgi:hypothetical protein